jgi:hypothetical protein
MATQSSVAWRLVLEGEDLSGPRNALEFAVPLSAREFEPRSRDEQWRRGRGNHLTCTSLIEHADSNVHPDVTDIVAPQLDFAGMQSGLIVIPNGSNASRRESHNGGHARVQRTSSLHRLRSGRVASNWTRNGRLSASRPSPKPRGG